MMMHKGYYDSHFDYLGYSGVNWKKLLNLLLVSISLILMFPFLIYLMGIISPVICFLYNYPKLHKLI